MSTIIKFDLKELKQLADDKKSCVVEKTITQNLALEPWCLRNLKESIKKTLDFKVGKFVQELNGILISYKNLRVLQNIGSTKNDKADLVFQVQGDFFIFQPSVGAILKGIVIKKSITHLRVLLHRVFNVIIPRPTEDRGNTWIGLNVQENEEVVFKVAMLDLYGALPYIRGELDERWIKLGQGSDDETIELSHTKIIGESHQQKSDDKPAPFPRPKGLIGLNILSSAKHDKKFDNDTTFHKQTADENDINLHSKSKSRRQFVKRKDASLM